MNKSLPLVDDPINDLGTDYTFTDRTSQQTEVEKNEQTNKSLSDETVEIDNHGRRHLLNHI